MWFWIYLDRFETCRFPLTLSRFSTVLCEESLKAPFGNVSGRRSENELVGRDCARRFEIARVGCATKVWNSGNVQAEDAFIDADADGNGRLNCEELKAVLSKVLWQEIDSLDPAVVSAFSEATSADLRGGRVHI